MVASASRKVTSVPALRGWHIAVKVIDHHKVLEGSLNDSPNQRSIEIMRAIDAMPEGWRALVHEYGFVAVANLYGDVDLEDADDALWLQR